MDEKTKKSVKLSDIISIMEKIAPSGLAEGWDNSGLQVGDRDWPVKKIWIALDPTPEVVDAACKNKIDLLVTHHPLIFGPLKSIDFGSATGSVIHNAAKGGLAVFSAHTNLDSAQNGLNDLLALRIGLKNIRPLCVSEKLGKCKFVVYVPSGHEHNIMKSIFETKAGVIGSYTCCSFRVSGKGTFRPGSSAKPFTGRIGEILDADEVRIEAVAQNEDVPQLIEHVRKCHPYETMAYDVYPLCGYENGRSGMGRIGELSEKTELYILAEKIKNELDLKNVKISGNPRLSVTHAAVCTGSGSSLMKDFIKSEAQVYITGDLRYHDARTSEAEGRGLIDIGHFASEHIIVEELAKRLRNMTRKAGYDVSVKACGIERDPFCIL
jgi:dinuclear metal center YbgI/SA1388 family protein